MNRDTVMRELRFGVEIETKNASKDILCQAIFGVVGGVVDSYRGVVNAADGRKWNVVHDGSIGNGWEVVTPILTWADIESTLQPIIRNIRTAGATVDSSCGIHVHVDAARFDARSLTRLARIVHRQEDLIFAALAPHSGRYNFTKKMDSYFSRQIARRFTSLRTLRNAWYDGGVETRTKYHQTRYTGLNLHSVWYRGTIEFRYFNSTLHAGVVKAYVQFCLALAATALCSVQAAHGRHIYNANTGRYDMRVLLLRLGLRGPEFETARQHLLVNLRGARSRGRLERRRAAGTYTNRVDYGRSS